MANVQMPDKSVVAFPDTMSDQEINEALAGWKGGEETQSAAPSPPSQTPSGLVRGVELTGKALGESAGNLLTIPGNIEQGLFGSGPSAPLPPAPPGTAYYSAPPIAGLTGKAPSFSDLAPITNALGITGTPQLTPTTPLERYGTAAVQAVPTAALGIATGGAALPTALSAGAGNELGELVHSVFPTSTWGPTVAGLLAGLGVGGVAGSMAKSAKVAQAAKDVLDTQAKLKLAQDNAFSGKFTNSNTAASVKQASADRFDSIKALAAETKASADTDAGNTFSLHARQLGESSTYQEAGQALQEHAQSWLDGPMQEEINKAKAPVLAAIPPTMTGPISEFESAVANNSKSAGALEFLASIVKPRLSGQFAAQLDAKDKLEGLTAEPGLDGPIQAGPRQYTFSDMTNFRSALGDAMRDPKVVSDIGAQNLKNLYRGLTADMRVMADRAGIVPQFDEYNTTASRLYSIAEGPVTRVLSGKPGDAASSLVSGAKRDATDLSTLRSIIPEGVSELAAAHLQQGGVKGWEKLGANPAAQEALVPAPDQRAALAGAVAVREQAVQNANKTIAEAADAHAAIVSAANQDLKNGNHALSKAVRDADDAAKAAKLAAGPPGHGPLMNRLGQVLTLGETIGGGVLGDTLAPALVHAAGLSHGGPLAATALTAAGMAAPWLYGGVKGIIRNQNDLALPLTGAVAGSNALTIPPPQNRR